MKLSMKLCLVSVCFSIFLNGTHIVTVSAEQTQCEPLVVSDTVNRSNRVVDFLGYLMSFFGASESSEEVKEIIAELQNAQERINVLTESNEFLIQENADLKDTNQLLITHSKLEYDRQSKAMLELLSAYASLVEQKNIYITDVTEHREKIRSRLQDINSEYQKFIESMEELGME